MTNLDVILGVLLFAVSLERNETTVMKVAIAALIFLTLVAINEVDDLRDRVKELEDKK